jgi:hypothetical protein
MNSAASQQLDASVLASHDEEGNCSDGRTGIRRRNNAGDGDRDDRQSQDDHTFTPEAA